MLYQIVKKLDQWVHFQSASAHCDIPCKIYDPMPAQIAVLTVIRMQDMIAELDGQTLTLAQQAQLARMVAEKEEHVGKVKDEIRVIWGDYIKQPQLDLYPDLHTLVHNIMLQASKCRQGIDRAEGAKLLELVNQFAEIFWQTKGVDTYTATCPYPPSEKVIYPKLEG